MNLILLLIIGIPTVEIYFMIKVGQQIGALFTIFLIFLTAVVGLFFARLEGINTLKSGFIQLSKNISPTYEMISGAAIAIAALLLIIPGFATDLFGFLLIFPLSRKLILNKFSTKFKKKDTKKENFIDGEFEDIKDEDDRKI